MISVFTQLISVHYTSGQFMFRKICCSMNFYKDALEHFLKSNLELCASSITIPLRSVQVKRPLSPGGYGIWQMGMFLHLECQPALQAVLHPLGMASSTSAFLVHLGAGISAAS